MNITYALILVSTALRAGKITPGKSAVCRGVERTQAKTGR